jgi:hypothetical protein
LAREHHADDATRATAHLPGLQIEIVHRRAADGASEQISINLRAVPSFEAFGRFLEGGSLFAFWAQAAQAVWLPWIESSRAFIPPAFTAWSGVAPKLVEDRDDAADSK